MILDEEKRIFHEMFTQKKKFVDNSDDEKKVQDRFYTGTIKALEKAIDELESKEKTDEQY